MDSMSAVCPECKKQITVNPSDVVEVCKWCNKPFRTSDAILLYRYQKTRIEATNQPSDDVIDKFYVIIEQDYKLAKEYLISFLAREYPRLYDEKLIYYYFSYIGAKDRGTSTERILLENIMTVRDHIESISAINPSIGGMYYKFLCATVNRLLREKGKLGQEQCFTGGLPYLKLQLGDVGSRLEKINSIKNILERNKFFKDKDYDDSYIFYVIERIIRFYAFKKPQDELIGKMEQFLSPEGRRELPALKKKIKNDADLLLHEARQKLYERVLPFWQMYINLLKNGNIVEAQRHLNRGNRFAYTEAVKKENAKFKRGFFKKLKYKGSVSSLTPDALAGLDVRNIKYNDISRFKR